MNESNVSDELYREFHQFHRNLTYLVVALVGATALIVWFLGIDVGGKRASMMGVIFMLLAYFTYQIPYISYRYLQHKYKNESEKRDVLGYDWKQFRDLAMQRR
ncbi:MAG: hypothetical protein P8X88_04490 [Gammaproteobacteria bacterium]